MEKHTTTVAAPTQKGTRRGADVITESQQQRSVAVAELTALVTPQKNDQKQGNQKKMKGSNIKNWLTSSGDKSKDAAADATVKEL